MVQDVNNPSMYCRGCSYILDGLPECRCPECGLPFDPAVKRTYRARPRILWVRPALTFLLVILVLGSVLFGVAWGILDRRQRIEQQAAEAVKAMGGTCFTKDGLDPRLQEWSRILHLPRVVIITVVHGFPSTFGDDDLKRIPALPRLELLRLGGTRITDAGLAGLGRFPRLQYLHMDECKQLAGQGLGQLKVLKNLENLDLSRTRVTDAGLAHLGELVRLRHLGLYDCEQITNEGLGHLKPLKNLEFLSLAFTHVSDAGLEHLAGLKSLKELNLAWTGAGDAGLAHLAGLTNLKHLDICDTRVTGAGCVSLRGMTSLEELNLSGLPIKGAGLTHIGTLASLRSLSLNRTGMTDDDLQFLKRLPRLEVLQIMNNDLTDKAIAHLKEMKSLTWIDLGGTRVTKQGLDELKAAFPAARYIDPLVPRPDVIMPKYGQNPATGPDRGRKPADNRK
jgi:hypothetical protein